MRRSLVVILIIIEDEVIVFLVIVIEIEDVVLLLPEFTVDPGDIGGIVDDAIENVPDIDDTPATENGNTETTTPDDSVVDDNTATE